MIKQTQKENTRYWCSIRLRPSIIAELMKLSEKVECENNPRGDSENPDTAHTPCVSALPDAWSTLPDASRHTFPDFLDFHFWIQYLSNFHLLFSVPHLYMSQIERIVIYGLKWDDFYSGCGGLSMDASHRLVYLNTWFLDGSTGAGWGGFRGVVLLEEV